MLLLHMASGFLSTPSARRATEHLAAEVVRANISIHALREEGDNLPQARFSVSVVISIHALREEGDYFAVHSPGEVKQFLSTPSARRATLFRNGKNKRH